MAHTSVDRYIEITGEGCYIENAARFVTDISVQVQAGKKETAFDKVNEFANEVVQTLVKAGIRKSEIVEGGTDYLGPWFFRKKGGATGVRKVILKVEDLSRLYSALEKLEPLKQADRQLLNVNMQQPEFETTSEAKAAALKEAYNDAKDKASELAAAMGCQLGPIIHIEECNPSRRSSGFTGDEDWKGDSDRFSIHGITLTPAGDENQEEEVILENPSRTIWVKCRARFQIGER